jgi:mono/diheme cytochrome c family protein
MKMKFIFSGLSLTFAIVLFTGCKSNVKPAVPEVAQPTQEQLVQKGEYLVTIMGCNDCHSPKKAGPQGPMIIAELMLSGYPADRPLPKVNAQAMKDGWMLMNEDMTAYSGPWGVSFAANLTSDQTGIGNWTEVNFKRALKEGKYKGLEGSRMLLPPMPWTNFTTLNDDDAKAIFAYLKSTKPVKNVIPMPLPPAGAK